MLQRKVDLGEQSLLYIGAWSKAMAHLEGMTRRRRKVVLSELFTSLRPQDISGVAAFVAGVPLPPNDLKKIGVTPGIIKRAFAEVTGSSVDEIAVKAAEAGGYPELALDILPHPSSPGAISLENVRAWLEELLGFAREPLEMTVFLLGTLDPLMSKYLLRILLGELPIGLAHTAVLEAVAIASRMVPESTLQCFELTNSIEDASERTFRGRRALAQVHCRTGRPYRLMTPTPAPSIASVFEQDLGAICVEPVVAGMRLEIHRRHAAIQLYTRELRDVTRAFPELAADLERQLVGTDDLILEGQVYLPGADAATSERAVQKRLARIPTRRGEVLKPEILLSVSMLELTRQGREDLMERGYADRRDRMLKLFKTTERVTVCESLPTESLEEAEAFAEDLRAKGASGVMLKPAKTTYTPGSQKAWYRVSLTQEQIDLVAIEASLNSAGEVSKINLACRYDGGLAAVGEVSGTGADVAQWRAVQSRIPDLVITKKGDRMQLKPDLVLTVLPKAIKVAPRRQAGFSLTGMKLVHIREDKSRIEANDSARLNLLRSFEE